MTTTSPSKLLAELARFGVTVYLKDGRPVVRHPWPGWEGVPAEAQNLLRQLKQVRLAVRGYLEAEEHAKQLQGKRPQNARELMFPYPLPETLGIGETDPLDYRFDVGRQEWVHEPGWWLSVRKQVH
jgi:hypothetical protein